MIAITVHLYTKDSYGLTDANYVIDVIMNILYFTAIDATLSVCQFNRSGVRVWHWKINLVVLASALMYFSNNPVLHYGLFIILMMYIYNKLKAEKKCFKVGLQKYMKSGNEDYHDLTIKRNYKYVLITIIEAITIYYHFISFITSLICIN